VCVDSAKYRKKEPYGVRAVIPLQLVSDAEYLRGTVLIEDGTGM